MTVNGTIFCPQGRLFWAHKPSLNAGGVLLAHCTLLHPHLFLIFQLSHLITQWSSPRIFPHRNRGSDGAPLSGVLNSSRRQSRKAVAPVNFSLHHFLASGYYFRFGIPPTFSFQPSSTQYKLQPPPLSRARGLWEHAD